MFTRACFTLMTLLAAAPAAGRPLLALLTDFGLENEAVGLCHIAALRIDPEIEVIDVCHTVPPFDVQLAGLMLRGTRDLPAGAAIVAVVDPGVGTTRAPIALRTERGLFYVAPDNGILTWVMEDQGVAGVVRLDPERINPGWTKGTFDGRDLFTPAGARLLRADGDLAALGDPIAAADLVRLPAPRATWDEPRGVLVGAFLREDRPYGNVWTTITRRDLEAAALEVGDPLEVVWIPPEGSAARADTSRVPLAVAFGDVPEGAPLAYVASAGNLALAVNLGDYRSRLGLGPGWVVQVGGLHR